MIGTSLGILGEEPSSLETAEGEAAQAQFSPYDYGSVGDQRPFQVVYPSYPAPQWLNQFAYLGDALRECGTLCQSYGVPFRVVKWGGRIPCMPCKQTIRDNRLPSIRVISKDRIYSQGALQGYPEATPVAEVRPDGTSLIYAPDGSTHLANRKNFYVASLGEIVNPYCANNPPPLAKSYVEAVKSAQYMTGNYWNKPSFVCSGFNQVCKGKKGVPVVYVQPGGIARRYPEEIKADKFGASTSEGSIVITQPVTPEMFRQLIALSEGGNTLPWNS